MNGKGTPKTAAGKKLPGAMPPQALAALDKWSSIDPNDPANKEAMIGGLTAVLVQTYMHGNAAWKKVIREILTRVKAGGKVELMRVARSLITGFVGGKKLSREVAQATLVALDEKQDEVFTQLTSLPL